MQRMGKILLWTLVVFLILRGIGTLFKDDRTDAARQLISDFVASRQYRERVEFEASAFAEGFAMEYLTYESGSKEEYVERIRKYVPAYLESLDMSFYSGVKAQGLTAQALRLSWKSQNSLNVDVRVKVQYFVVFPKDNENAEAAAVPEIVTKDVYIRIPVTEKEGKYIVDDYPAFIPQPEKAEAVFDYYSGSEADRKISGEITGVLENFFKTYYSGSAGEIAYYMLDSSRKIKGLEGRYKLSRMHSVKVYKPQKEEERYLALVTLSVEDSTNQQQFFQRFHVQLVKKEGRFYIGSFDVRIGNLNQNELESQN